MKVPPMQRVPKEIRELPEETYQELVETERKYLLLLEELNSFSKSLENYQESIGSFLEKTNSNTIYDFNIQILKK